MAIVSVIATRGGIARAVCAPEPAHFEPNDGTVLPPDPTIYFFTGHETEAAAAITANVPIKTELVSRGNNRVIYRVRISASRGDVTLSYGEHTTVRYRIGPVAPNHARIVDVEHESGFGGCSAWDYVRLSTRGTAIAFRVDWDDRGPPAFLPGDDARIGLIGCTVATSTDAELATLRSFELVALFADGSEQSLGRASIMFGELRIRLPLELLGEEAGYVGRYRQPWLTNLIVDILGLLALALALRSLHRTLRRSRECTFPFARVV